MRCSCLLVAQGVRYVWYSTHKYKRIFCISKRHWSSFDNDAIVRKASENCRDVGLRVLKVHELGLGFPKLHELGLEVPKVHESRWLKFNVTPSVTTACKSSCCFMVTMMGLFLIMSQSRCNIYILFQTQYNATLVSLPEISDEIAPAFGWINSRFSRWRRNTDSDYIWRIYKSENWCSQEVRWQSADLLTPRPMTGELFPTLFIKIDSNYTLPNKLL